MNQRDFLRILTVAAIHLILTATTFISSAYASYNFTTVNMDGSDSTKAYDINDAGLVVGHYLSSEDNTWHGFTFDGTTYTSYEMPEAGATRFIGINDTGLITGEYYADGTDWSGFIYNGSTWSPLVVPNAARTDPRGINNSGHVAGWNRGPLYCAGYGFFYDGSAFTTIEYPGTDESACLGGSEPLDETRVLGINDAGTLVGFYVIDNILHGFTYEGGAYTTFDNPAWPVSYASGINDTGQIVGAYKDNGTWKTYVYDSGTWSELFIPGSTYTIASGINNNGVITGYYNDGATEYGFIATPSTPVNINLPQTGQTTSYSAGDDGDLQIGAAWPTTGNMGTGRFNNNGDGTVSDLLTGLMWTMNANLGGLVDFYSARDAAAALATGGHTDWRIPNILELESLTHAGEADTSAWLNNIIGFQNAQSAEYWSSTQYVDLGNGGWTINLGTDQTNYWMPWTDARYYWPVRGGANSAPDLNYPANVRDTGRTTSTTANDDGDLEWGVDWSIATRYIDNGNGTITDMLTGLMWLQNVTTEGSMGEMLPLAGAFDYVDDMNTGINGRCVPDVGNLPRCYPWENSCGPGNNQPCPLPKTDCPDDFTCVGAVEESPAAYGECKRTSIEHACNVPSDCPAIVGGEFPGTYNDQCVTIPNAGYTDWRLPNKKEMLSLTHWEDEFSTDELTTAGFTVYDFGWCSHWTSTADPTDPLNRVFGVALNTGGHQMLTFPLLSDPGHCRWTYKPKYVWPVRTASAPEPNISVTPASYDIGDVVQGIDSDFTFTINNIGNSDLSIINIAQNDTIDPPFSLVSGQDNCSGTIVAPSASCTFDVRFSPVGRGFFNDTFDIESNDPDTNMLIVSVTGTGTTAFLTELPRTGQTTSYSAGDDGDLQMGAAWPTTGNMGTGRFNNNGDGTVSDLLTGLMWTMNANLGGSVDFYSARDAAAALATGGHTDWRIPNILELESLTHAGEADTSAWLNNTIGFQNAQSAEYWSSTQYVDLGNGGWTINLGTDQTNYWMPWTDARYYWPVRGGANGAADLNYPANVRDTGRTTFTTADDDGELEWGVDWSIATRYIDNGNGTITDMLTGLMWLQDVTTEGSMGEMLPLAGAFDYVDDMNTGINGRCVPDVGNLPRCYPWENSCGPGNDQPCPLPKTDCPDDFTCVGAVEESPAAYGECKRTSIEHACNVPSDCPAIVGGEFPGTYNDICAAIPNAGYTDWRLPNKKEMLSLTHWEDEFSTDELTTAGFTVYDFGWCSHWTSTADPADPLNMVFGVALNTGGHQMLTFPLLSDPGHCRWTYKPKYVWPVRTASAPEPNISVTPASYDFGNVAVGVTTSTVFTIENLSSGDLVITSISIPLSDFSVQSEDCTTLSPLAQNDTCSISVDFTPSAESAMTEDLSVVSNDPDTPVLTAGLTGTGIPAAIDLELSKTVNDPSPVVGSAVLFTVAITNNGPADATGVSVVDVVPDGYSNIMNINNGGNEVGGTITWNGLSIASGDVLNLTFNADVNASGNYLNVAQITAADQIDIDSTPNNDNGDQSEDDEDNAIVTPIDPSQTIDLELNKSVNNPVPDIGSTITFTVSVSNIGPSDASGVTVQDVVPNGYSNIQNISHGGTEKANAAVQYKITDLGITPFSSSPTRFDINDSGQVVGNYDVGGGLSHGFFWENGSLTDLGVLSGGSYSEAIGINNNNQAVGFATNSNGHERAVLWEFSGGSWGTAQDLGTYGGNQGWAENINDAGFVSGHATYSGSNNAHATIWDTNVSGFPKTDLPGAPFDYGGGINSAGHVVSTSFQGSNWIAYHYDGTTMQNMGTLGGTKAVGYDVNDFDQATGFSSIGSSQNRAFLWTSGGGMQNLGVLSGDTDSYASGINNSAQVVGTSVDASGVQHAFLWDSVNGMQDLNDLVINGTGWVLQHTADINESGAIVGYGTFNGQARAFVLNVVTEAGGTITWSGLSINNSAAVNLTFDADVNASGNYTNVAQVIAADQIDNDSSPNNDDGDQTEDDEDNAIVTPIPSDCTLLRIRNFDTSAEFCTIQEAYIAAGNNQTLYVQAYSFTETIDFNIDKSVTVVGGYDNNYSTVIGNTTIIGNVTSSNGSVILGNFILE